MRHVVGVVAVLLSLAAPAGWVAVRSHGPASPTLTTKLRRPVAVVTLPDVRTVCVANRCGTVSVVDLLDRQVRDEIAVGQSLFDIVALPDHRHLLAVDEEAGDIVALAVDATHLAV